MGIDQARWELLSPYLDQALDFVDEHERAVWLTAFAQRHPDLVADIHSLLAEHRAVLDERFLEQPADRSALDTVPGMTVGAYKLVSPIGHGGMGTVWTAERIDGRFERRAAIKFLNLALLGRGEERFKREGLIVARLAHPHVAQLLDAGVSSAGQPYLVLEHVDGEQIDRYCETKGLGVDDRVRLFIDVLDAVAYAHANLIVHRDIKPSNVLVDRGGQVKLLDFGVAKLLAEDGGLGAPTVLTQEFGHAMTPEYAAPEQITGQAVTTATDVYALGVLLYVLLTGRHPAGATKAPAELVKAILETTPKRPSESAPETVRRHLRGDLDTIVGKALKKESSERYGSVSALADDLRRYLRNEPISARPDTLAYRSRKFVRRNRLAVAVATIAVAALAAGLYTVNLERTIAERRFTQVRRLSSQMIALDVDLRGLRSAAAVRRRVVASALEYLDGISAEARNDRELALEIGTGYLDVARVQGVPTNSNLGQFDAAEHSLERAQRFIETAASAGLNDPRTLLASARIAHDRMVIATLQERRSDAIVHAERLRSIAGEPPLAGGLARSLLDEIAGLRRAASITLASVDGSRPRGKAAVINAPRRTSPVPGIGRAWGFNEYGVLGDGHERNTNPPSDVDTPRRFVVIAAGVNHSGGIASDGSVWGWGRHLTTLGSFTGDTRPVRLPRLEGPTAVAAAYGHNLAIGRDGRLWAWGSNLMGQLGDGTRAESALPIQVREIRGVVAAAGGASHSVALTSDGTVWTWGNNFNGQLGNGTNDDLKIPARVPQLSYVVAISAGSVHTLAVKSDGMVWSWGFNQFGQLGDGANVDTNVPVRVVGLHDVVAVAGGNHHSLALKADGTVWSWGSNEDGVLGTGSPEWSNVPVQVSGLSDVIAIDAARSSPGFNLALKSDGTVWGWGGNSHGELGHQGPRNSAVPIPVPGIAGAVAIAAGGAHGLAVVVEPHVTHSR